MSDDGRKEGKQATPADTLEEQITSSTFPKNEREWWAHHEIERLRALLETANIYGVGENAARIAAEADRDRLRELLQGVLIGGNHVALLIGADHPPHTAPWQFALSHYGAGDKYEAWCCWRAIMQARDELDRIDAELGEEKYTYGHCKEKAQQGGCQLHNLHCGYPACDRRKVSKEQKK